jgi:hypothetical protein
MAGGATMNCAVAARSGFGLIAVLRQKRRHVSLMPIGKEIGVGRLLL